MPLIAQMAYLLGIDLGTSSVKCLLMREDGHVLAVAEREYPIEMPRPGYAEQDPERWWLMTVEAIREILAAAAVKADSIRAIGLSGQMHGTVCLGAGGAVLRPAIIWPDRRTVAQCREIHMRVGLEKLARIAGSGVFPGFMCASLLWLKQNEPKTWDRLRHVVFPKDYVRLRLTGEVATEATDASGGVLIDIQRRHWSAEILHCLDIPTGILPAIRESQEVVGSITHAASATTGILRGTPVVAGASDQATGALGSAITAPGMVSATIGTGGQMVAFLATAQTDSRLRVHTFCHATPGTWFLLGATLAAGLAFRWLRDDILEERGSEAYSRMTAQAASIAPGSEGLLFLPCLVGERTLDGSPPTRGAFFGLTPRHRRPHLIRSVMEGITFDLRRVLDTFKELGVAPERMVASGGGARSEFWRQMMADTFGVPVVKLVSSEQSAVGAAILAGLGTDVYANVAEGCAAAVHYGPTVEPEPAGVAAYSSAYERFCSLYDSLRPEFARFEGN